MPQVDVVRLSDGTIAGVLMWSGGRWTGDTGVAQAILDYPLLSARPDEESWGEQIVRLYTSSLYGLRMAMGGPRRLASVVRAGWSEGAHPRDDKGKWAPKGTGAAQAAVGQEEMDLFGKGHWRGVQREAFGQMAIDALNSAGWSNVGWDADHINVEASIKAGRSTLRLKTNRSFGTLVEGKAGGRKVEKAYKETIPDATQVVRDFQGGSFYSFNWGGE